jgi:hypothetical protein
VSAFAGKSKGCKADVALLGEPPVPADLDLRNFPFMPLDVVRLVDSDLTAIATGEEFKAAVILWCKAWHQVPASSLPDDDRMLAHLSGFGRDVKGWQKVREVALRGFVKCSDGRLYHPVIAEKAREAGDAKQRQRARTQAATAARRQRDDNRNDERHDQRDDERDDARNGHRYVHQGTGTGTGTGIKEEEDRARKRFAFEQTESALKSVQELAGHPVKTAPVIAPILKLVTDDGLDLDTQILPSIRRQALAATRPIRGWGYFVPGIRQDAETPSLSPGAANGSFPRSRRRSPGQEMRDAIADVKAHIAQRERDQSS